MPFLRTSGGLLFTVIAALGVCTALGPASLAQVPAAAKNPKISSPEKRLAFEMRDKPWKEVFAWLSDQTGLPVMAAKRPAGTFTFLPPRGADKLPRRYTIQQIFDFLNEGLLAGTGTEQFVLVRRQNAFVLVPVNQPDGPLPRVTLAELEKRSKTEVVSVILPLQALDVEEFQPQIEKMMGPAAKAIAFRHANALYLQDTAGNLSRIVAMVKDIEKTNHGEIYLYQCRYSKARHAEQTLMKVLGDAREALRLGTPQAAPGNSEASPREAASPDQAAGLPRMHYVASDERTNTVLVSGPADKIAQARAVLQKIDVPQASAAGRVDVGSPSLKTYAVPAGNADALAKDLEEASKVLPGLRVAPIGNFSIMVWAEPDHHVAIARLLQGAGVNARMAEVIALHELEAVAAAKTLRGLYENMKSGAPSIQADSTRNTIVFRGTNGQAADVKAVLQALGEGERLGGAVMRISATRNSILIRGGTAQLAEVAAALQGMAQGGRVLGGRMRVLSLESGSAATVAEAVQHLLPRMRKNAIKIIDPVSGAEQEVRRQPTDKNPWDYFLADRDAKGAPKQPENKAADRPGKQDLPVTLIPFGSKLIVISDDPQALKEVHDLVQLLTQTRTGEGDFQVIRLKNADATQAAQALDELFNGVKPRRERIRVVADPSTNSLLVRASPIDLVTIRGLLARAIDTGEIDSRALMRTWVIGPLKNARARDAARVLRDVYREYINNNPALVTVSSGPFGFFGTRQFGTSLLPNVDANGNPVGVTLSIGVDDPTNTLVLHCTALMHDEIRKLVAQLDRAAAQSARTVKVLSIRGVDPVLMQQAVDAIQGRRPLPANQTGTQGVSPSGSGGSSAPGATGSPSRRALPQGAVAPGSVGANSGGFRRGGY